MATLLWLIPATIASRSINICSEIHSQVFWWRKIHSSVVSWGNCAIALLLFLVQPSRKCNLQCLYDLNCICLSEVQLYLLLFTLYGDVYVLTTSMNGYPDVTHLSCINCYIQGHSVHKQNPIYWNNCLHNQVQCPSL